MHVMTSLTRLSQATYSLLATAEVFGFSINSWMNSDITHRSEIYWFCQVFVDKHVDFSYHTVKARSSDDVINHSNDVISLSLFYSNYKDAIKEGDGQRVKLLKVPAANI